MLRTILGAAGITTLAALPIYLMTAQSVLIREDLDFTEPQLGLAVSLFFGAGAVGSVVAGLLYDRIGRRANTVAAGCLAVVSSGGLATVATSYPALLVLVALAGLANAGLQVTANATIAGEVPAARRGLAFALKQCAVPISIMLGGLAVPTIGVLFGWRWTFGVAASAAVLVTVVSLRRTAPTPLRAKSSPRRQGAPPDGLVFTGIAMTLAGAVCTSLGAFFPAWAFETGLQPGTAGLLLAALSLLAILGRILAGLVADRRRGRHLHAVAVHLLVGAVGLFLLALGSTWALVAGGILAFAVGWSWPGLLLHAVVRVGRDRPATASSVVQLGAFVGGAVGPVSFGLLVGATGYPVAWVVSGLLLLTSAALMLVARRRFLVDLLRRPLPSPLDAVPPRT